MMKKTLWKRISASMLGLALLCGAGPAAMAAVHQVDAYGRDYTRVEGGTYFAEQTGENTYMERIFTYTCPANHGGKHLLEYHNQAPTCTESDYNANVCVLCGERELYVEFPALGHDYAAEVTTPATADQAGVRTYTCTRCGDSYTEAIPALGGGTGEASGSQSTEEHPASGGEDSCMHDWYYDKEAATCAREGRWFRTCKTCGKTETLETYEKIPHSYVAQVTTPATADHAGVRTYTCSVCGESYTEAIPKLESAGSGTSGGEPSNSCAQHTWQYSSKQATCTQEGQYVRTCLKCGASEVVRTLPALGHLDQVIRVVRPATVDQEGQQLCRCSRCGAEYTKPIPRLDQSTAATTTGLRNSGSTDLEKLSAEEISALLQKAPVKYEEDVFVQEPSIKAPFSTGEVKESALQEAADRLNALRRIAGLPAVELDEALCRSAQYGAVIQAATRTLNHYPSQIAGMSDAFYKEARSASSTSNLSAGYSLTGAVDAFMDDSDASNISSVGHRRWQLNPELGKVGFGYAESGAFFGTYVAEKVFDTSGVGCDYDFVSWPASGNFPSQLMTGQTAWSVTLNPEEYAAPDSAVEVTLTRQSDGKTWTLKNGSGDGFFRVSNSSYGTGSCIIFRPDGVEAYAGTYTVQIRGLQAQNGQQVADFSYEVKFFDSEDSGASSVTETEPTAGTQPQTPAGQEQPQPETVPGQEQTGANNTVFRDVPTAHWANASIAWAAKQGIVNGYADGTFRPAATVTNAQFDAMLARAFYPDALAGYTGAWWEPGTRTCLDQGILTGTTLGQNFQDSTSRDSLLNTPISRLDMAQMMYRLLVARSAAMPDAAALRQAQTAIGDWDTIPTEYRQAVSVCYALGLLNGQNDGTFGGTNSMNRAQGCTVIVRLVQYLEDGQA